MERGMRKNIVELPNEIRVISKFDLEAELYEARQRCFWFIDGIGIHGLDSKLFSSISTERLCEMYNIDISFFRK
jgi:hypothetical protein